MRDHTLSHTLSLGAQPVAEYVWQPELPPTVSPRPFLHPVRTLSGTEVTELMPADHQHHLGVSVAVADVGGANFWGGRTFVPHRGPVHLPNHGTQRHHSWVSRTPTTIAHDLRWTGPDGVQLLQEHRHIAALPISDQAESAGWGRFRQAPSAWALDFTFELTNVTTGALTLASPATNGRPGAGYGGFFWRARRGDQRIHVLGPDRTGERHLHGRRAPWLALTGGGAAPWTLIFVFDRAQCPSDRWFVRSRDYAGVGSSLAWDRPVIVAPGAGIRRRIITVVADGRLRSGQIAGVAGAVLAVPAGAGQPA